jgi:hypothetical protein
VRFQTDEVDLDQCLRDDERHDLHRRARRRLGREVLAADLAHAGEVVQRGEVGPDLHGVGEGRAVRIEDRLQVLEHLPGLCTHVVRSNEAPRGVDRDLPGDMDPDGVSGLDADGLGVRPHRCRDGVGVRTGRSHALLLGV